MAFHLIDRIAVEDDGAGDAVVCVHGLGGSSNTWTPLLPALAGLRVIRPDLPGSARSAAAGGVLSIERLAEAVVGVCSRLGIGRAHFLGHSMGTIVCQHVAATNPGLVRSLALFGPLIVPGDPARTAIRARAEQARGGTSAMQAIAQTLSQAAVSADTRTRAPTASAFVRESLMRQDPDGYARSCDALAEARPAALDRIEAPVLLVTGDEDTVAPPQAVRAMAERLGEGYGTAGSGRRASVRVVVLSRCGHWTPIERPEECARVLRAFLAGVR
jgi:pimeloyl-ACP methyl ester carboxylesterase